MQRITILGATGSIGTNTLDVLALHPDKYKVFALTAHSNVELLLQQCIRFQPEYVVVSDTSRADEMHYALQQHNLKCELLVGNKALAQVASADGVDIVMAAIVGGAGLLPTFEAIKAGKKVLLANKESLVMSGHLFMQAVQQYGATLLPIDSEHNAIFQCLPAQYQSLQQAGVDKILLTGSGGPFRDEPLASLPLKTPEQACAHPNWDMGKKISVDSATMMNKGLEYIEACWLFNAEPEQIEVVLHPQSIIHSMVRYNDGSVLAQMGAPDMKTPIAHALAYPQRIISGAPQLDFMQIGQLTFAEADFDRYPCLKLAIDAHKHGGHAPIILNAANEVAVERFLAGQIGFGDIATVITKALEGVSSQWVDDIDAVIAIDAQARQQVSDFIRSHWG